MTCPDFFIDNLSRSADVVVRQFVSRAKGRMPFGLMHASDRPGHEGPQPTWPGVARTATGGETFSEVVILHGTATVRLDRCGLDTECSQCPAAADGGAASCSLHPAHEQPSLPDHAYAIFKSHRGPLNA